MTWGVQVKYDQDCVGVRCYKPWLGGGFGEGKEGRTKGAGKRDVWDQREGRAMRWRPTNKSGEAKRGSWFREEEGPPLDMWVCGVWICGVEGLQLHLPSEVIRLLVQVSYLEPSKLLLA